MSVDQFKLEHAGVGLRAWDPNKACAGLTLFTPVGADSTVYLIDLGGEIVHTWCMPYPALHGYLTDHGTLVYRGRIDSPDERFLSSMPCKGGVLLEVDSNGEVVWEVRHPDHHHDGLRLANGNALLLCMAEVPCDIAQRVAGGRLGSEYHGRMYADYLVEMTTNGRCVWEWRSWEHLDAEQVPILPPEDARTEWMHGNTVVELAKGDLMLSFELMSTVTVDRHSGAVVHKLGPARLNKTRPIASRNSIISTVQRLWNGNTLINEGASGRIFEVTAEGDVVWDYVNPYFCGPTARDQQNAVLRAYRYPLDRVAKMMGAG